MSELITFSAHAYEENSCIVKFQITGNDGVQPVPGSVVTSAVLTFWDKLSGVIINDWDHVDVTDKINESGWFIWALTAVDNAVFATDDLVDEETHVGTIEVEADNGEGVIKIKRSFLVVVENELEEPIIET